MLPHRPGVDVVEVRANSVFKENCVFKETVATTAARQHLPHAEAECCGGCERQDVDGAKRDAPHG